LCLFVFSSKRFLPFGFYAAHGQSNHGEKKWSEFCAPFLIVARILYGQSIAILLTLLGFAVYKFSRMVRLTLTLALNYRSGSRSTRVAALV
jgi:hypothetical protein